MIAAVASSNAIKIERQLKKVTSTLEDVDPKTFKSDIEIKIVILKFQIEPGAKQKNCLVDAATPIGLCVWQRGVQRDQPRT